MGNYILAIDQSTAGTKAIIFNRMAEVVSRCDVPHRQYRPQPGWLEHDPEEIYQNVIKGIRGVLTQSGIPAGEIHALSVTNQRETTLLWTPRGEPAYRAVVWQCARAEEWMKRPSIVASYPMIMESTGLMPSPYFSAAKAAWIMEHIQPKEKLLFGTMDSWVLWKLTGNHVTDFSNASRTQLFHIRDLRWDPNLLELFGLQNVEMPQVKCSDEIFGYTTAEGIFPHPIPVSGIMGDSHGALFGQQCWQRGMAKCTFGTGGSVMMNIGDVPLPSQNRLATSIAWGLGGAVTYVFEGVIMSMGDTIRWLADEMGLIQNSGQSEPLAEQVPSTGGVYLVPAFGGLGAPYWNSTARGLICGIQRDTDKRHVVRAGLESIAYQIRDIIEPMAKDAGLCFSELRVDGGPTNNRWLMQFTADLLGVSVVKNDVEELSSLGAAYAGGLATGFWKDREELESLRKTADIYQRKVSEKTADDCYQGWKQAVSFLTKT